MEFFRDAIFDHVIQSMGIPASLLTGPSTYSSSRPALDQLQGISDRMFGLQMMVNRYMCQPRFVRWARWPKSRRKRIRKKWRKKYGPVMKCMATDATKIGSMLFMCPHVAERFKKL